MTLDHCDDDDDDEARTATQFNKKEKKKENGKKLTIIKYKYYNSPFSKSKQTSMLAKLNILVLES